MIVDLYLLAPNTDEPNFTNLYFTKFKFSPQSYGQKVIHTIGSRVGKEFHELSKMLISTALFPRPRSDSNGSDRGNGAAAKAKSGDKGWILQNSISAENVSDYFFTLITDKYISECYFVFQCILKPKRDIN
jgi:hypothetical protein